jgi:hypothetical protein
MSLKKSTVTPMGLSLLCGVNRITEAVFLFYCKQQQKEIGEKRTPVVPDHTYNGGWDVLCSG